MGGDLVRIDWVYLDRQEERDLHPGDLISSEAGGMPIYRITALRDGRVWMRDMDDGSDRAMAPGTFHWKAM